MELLCASDLGENGNMEDMKEEREEVREEEHGLTRRTFIKGAVAAGAVLAGGAVLGHDTLVKWLQRMGFYPFSDGFYVERLRQIVTQDPCSGRVIMWETPKESAGQMLEVQAPDVDDVLRFPAVDAAFTDDDVTVHQYLVEVDQLVPGVEYRYRITAEGGTTAWLPLVTPDPDLPYKMLLFPDSQSSDYADWQQMAHLAWAGNTDAAFFACLGDLVDNGEDRYQWTEFFKGVDEMERVIPMAPVMGNHETYDRQWQTRLPVAYLNYFRTPRNGSKAFGRYYYSFDYGQAHYIVLCTQQKEIDGFKSGLVEEQLAWIRRDLKAHRKKWNIVLMHKDVLQYRIHGRPERSEGIDEEIGRVWMPVFDELLIDVVFTAHLHTYRNRGHIYAFAKTPEQKGPLYILTGVAGNVRYPNLWIDHAFDEVTLPQPETDNYLTMEVAADQIDIACFLPDGTEMDRVTVTKQ